MSNLQEFPITVPQATPFTMLRATIRTHRGEIVSLGFKGVPLAQVRERVAKAAARKFPYGFTFTVREA